MTVSALGKVEAPVIKQALTGLAQALLSDRQLLADDGWTARRLAMVANGLGKGEGPDVQKALTHLAQALLGDRQKGRWSRRTGAPRDLAMMANGLSKGGGRGDQGRPGTAGTDCPAP